MNASTLQIQNRVDNGRYGFCLQCGRPISALRLTALPWVERCTSCQEMQTGEKHMSLRPWGVILAGGDGMRLKAVSRLVSGDNRPKQFCTLFGSRSLLARTRGRLAPAISSDRMIFAVVRDHEPFYQPELADVEESRIVVQPANRGTTAAIIYSLLRLTRLEKDPIVAFFPSDHHFADEIQFARAVDAAFEEVHKDPLSLVLLGARADKAEVEYGWIEPRLPIDNDPGGSPSVFRVNRFWEKPSIATARALLSRGCLWNTFVIAGQARSFLEVIESTIPDALEFLRPLGRTVSRDEETERAARLYESLPTGDFSREVLTRCPDRLAVLRMEGAGWGDLGTPEGVLAAIQSRGAYRRRLEEVCHAAAGEPISAERHH
jgi:mannose-1-phosphate guanylyltransferase